MDIKHMKYFVEIVKQNSMTKAAESLYIAQPTLSRAIKDIEKELAMNLFDRNKRKLVLTDAGEVFYEQCNRIIQMYDNLPTELNNLLGINKGHIKIGLPPIMNVNKLIIMLSQFHEKYPNITFQLIENGSKRIEERVDNDEIDVGITVLPTEEGKYNTFILLEESLQLVVDKSHRYAERELIHLSEIKDDNLILFNKDFFLNDKITEACKSAGFLPNVVAESSQWNFIEQMILNKLGICILPTSIIEMLDSDLHAVKIDKPTLTWKLGVIWKKDAYTTFVTKEWLKFLQEQMILDND